MNLIHIYNKCNIFNMALTSTSFKENTRSTVFSSIMAIIFNYITLTKLIDVYIHLQSLTHLSVSEYWLRSFWMTYQNWQCTNEHTALQAGEVRRALLHWVAKLETIGVPLRYFITHKLHWDKMYKITFHITKL